MSRRAQVKREAQERLTERLAEQEAARRLRDMTIVERNRRGRPVSVERPLPYGALPPSAAETPGFVVGMPVDPTTFPTGQPPATGLSDDVDVRASEMERMRQQYGAGASFWNTDEGKDLLLDTMSNQYTGDQAGLPGFYQDQAKAGLGQMDMIKKALGYEEGSAMAAWADANPALALREYNKRQPNSYSGTGPSDEEIKAAMEAGQFSPSAGSPNPLGETGMARESNTAQTAAAQPVNQQRQLNLDEVQNYMDSGVPGLNGKQMLGEAIKKKIALTPTQLRNDPFLR